MSDQTSQVDANGNGETTHEINDWGDVLNVTQASFEPTVENLRGFVIRGLRTVNAVRGSKSRKALKIFSATGQERDPEEMTLHELIVIGDKLIAKCTTERVPNAKRPHDDFVDMIASGKTLAKQDGVTLPKCYLGLQPKKGSVAPSPAPNPQPKPNPTPGGKDTDVNDELQELQQQLDAANRELETLRQTAGECPQQLADAQQRITSLEEQIQRLQVEAQQHADAVSAAEEARQQAEERSQELESQLEDLRERLEDVDAQHTQAVNEYNELHSRYQELSQEAQRASQALQRYEQDLRLLQSERDAQEQRISDLTVQIEQFNALIISIRDSIGNGGPTTIDNWDDMPTRRTVMVSNWPSYWWYPVIITAAILLAPLLWYLLGGTSSPTATPTAAATPVATPDAPRDFKFTQTYGDGKEITADATNMLPSEIVAIDEAKLPLLEVEARLKELQETNRHAEAMQKAKLKAKLNRQAVQDRLDEHEERLNGHDREIAAIKTKIGTIENHVAGLRMELAIEKAKANPNTAVIQSLQIQIQTMNGTIQRLQRKAAPTVVYATPSYDPCRSW